MKQRFWMFALLALLAAGCSAAPSTTAPAPTATVPQRPTHTPPPSATPAYTPTVPAEEEVARRGLPLLMQQDEFFSTSGNCVICHTNMEDDAGADVSIDAFWRATMMANAARDPYWQATVQSEIEANPDRAAVIENKCSSCHMPMANFTLGVEGEQTSIFGAQGLLNPEHELNPLAMDGVSCSLCHQIREEGLGTEASYSGGFQVDTELRSPDRVIYGPYSVEDNQAAIMQSSSGFRPAQGLQLSRSELCASCHTLYTTYVDANGEVAGEFPEQVPYLEWFYSDYRRTQSCQDCHMPDAEGGVRISITSDSLRSPFAKHSFVGGNAYMLTMLDAFGEELEVTASSDHFEASIQRTLDQLQNDTARLTLDEVRLAGSRLTAEVSVENLAGHKFPSGFPARRAWLHFVVRDAEGAVVFESGGYRPDGSIIGNDNDADPQQVEQHYKAIVQPEQVEIYEAIMRDTEGDVTTTLLRSAAYVKDNRLLPAGFEKSAPYEDIAVRGAATEDENFLDGSDRISYIVDLGDAAGPFTVEVELLYQSISYRWAQNMRGKEAPEIERFLGYYDALPNTPVVVASASASTGE